MVRAAFASRYICFSCHISEKGKPVRYIHIPPVHIYCREGCLCDIY